MVTLPDAAVFGDLQNRFVLGWHNIRREDHVGYSNGYGTADSAVGTTNGAGPHNVQLFVLSEDLVVLHALPGFWHPQDLARELRLAHTLHELWKSDRPRQQKETMFQRLQLAAPRYHPEAMRQRSAWQGFDEAEERMRLRQLGVRDTFQLTADGTDYVRDAAGQPQLKRIDVLVHERLARQPFVPFAEFDVAAFTDYGRYFYDNNLAVDGAGKAFPGQARLMAQRDREARRQARKRPVLPRNPADM